MPPYPCYFTSVVQQKVVLNSAASSQQTSICSVAGECGHLKAACTLQSPQGSRVWGSLSCTLRIRPFKTPKCLPGFSLLIEIFCRECWGTSYMQGKLGILAYKHSPQDLQECISIIRESLRSSQHRGTGPGESLVPRASTDRHTQPYTSMLGSMLTCASFRDMTQCRFYQGDAGWCRTQGIPGALCLHAGSCIARASTWSMG